jgi:carbonic anhydrase/acetyltransferase-like protein (isoleucine patch superfamily)
MGATVLDGAVIEAGGVLAAGALLPPGKRVGRRELWVGSPARFQRVLDEEEQAGFAVTPGELNIVPRRRRASA